MRLSMASLLILMAGSFGCERTPAEGRIQGPEGGMASSATTLSPTVMKGLSLLPQLCQRPPRCLFAFEPERTELSKEFGTWESITEPATVGPPQAATAGGQGCSRGNSEQMVSRPSDNTRTEENAAVTIDRDEIADDLKDALGALLQALVRLGLSRHQQQPPEEALDTALQHDPAYQDATVAFREAIESGSVMDVEAGFHRAVAAAVEVGFIVGTAALGADAKGTA